MNEFYCGSCGKMKPLESKVVRKGKRPVCKNCQSIAKQRRKKPKGFNKTSDLGPVSGILDGFLPFP